MTVRTAGLVGFVTSGAVVAGLAIAPLAGSAAAGTDDPSFYAISTDAVVPATTRVVAPQARSAAGVVAARGGVKKSKGEQILQAVKAIQGVGSDGLSVAAGAKHVLQAGSFDGYGAVRAYTKKTGKQAKTALLNQFFAIKVAQAEISQPALAYDPVGKRFIAVAVTDDAGDIGMVMRVSKSQAAVPFGKKKWFKPVRFSESTSPIGPDTDAEANPQVGVSSNKIAITATTDNAAPNRIYMFPKGPYYKGNTSFGAWAANVNTTYDGQSPAINASKQPNAFIAIPDTGDVTATTYTGKAKNSPPAFSKNVVFPTPGKGDLTVPPIVDQPGLGDDLDLGGLAFTGAIWRAHRLWAAGTVDCSGRACVRVFEIGTNSGVTLMKDEKLKVPDDSLFSPAIAVDGAGYAHVVATQSGPTTNPGLVVLARTGTKGMPWTAPRFVRTGKAPALPNSSTSDWWKSNAASIDPTSPWDVWVAGPAGASGVANQLTSRVARVSLAKNQATLKTSTNSVNKGNKVTFKAKLSRPGGDVIKGLPIKLQKKSVHGGKWKTIKSGKTSAKGKAVWKVKVKKPALYRTLGKAKKQQNNQGKVFDKATSKAKKITLN